MVLSIVSVVRFSLCERKNELQKEKEPLRCCAIIMIGNIRRARWSITMGEDRSADSPKANTPLTEEQIIAATVGAPPLLNSTIDLAPYDPAWPVLFDRLAQHISEALGDAVLLLEHAGSTTVPGLSANPIIDMV